MFAGASSLACTVVETDGNSPFATAAAPVTTMTPGTETGEPSGSGTEDAATEGSGGGSSEGGETTTGMADSSGDGVVGTTTGVTTVGSTDDGGGGSGMQPDMGMYAPCTVGDECGFLPNLCITISDAGGVVIDGFCSAVACTNAAVDCDPSPGGTAVPVCVSIVVNDLPDTACALDCAGGATCPIGMTCYNLTGLGEVCG